jgi:sulfatase maturation enzyme AslB (radical SAM superfamily)
MSWETAKTIIDRIFSYSVEDYSTIIFEFIGGEPFMEIELIE